jgi:hypothetical protein
MTGVAGIAELLSEDKTTAAWIEHLDRIGEPNFELTLPGADALPPVLLTLAVPHEDIDVLVGMLPDRQRAPQVWWLLERCTHALIREMGTVSKSPMFPALPERIGALHRYFYVYVFLAALPHVRAFHRTREIPDEVSRLTLADLGRNMAVHRRRHGVGGLDVAFWLMRHFRATIYQLGRLQFEQVRLGNRTGNAIAATGLPYGPGDPALSVHIPAFYGPLTPQACDESFAQAKEFFARYFPEEDYRIAVCRSWLLDSQLAEYLPEDANILRFQRRFRPAYKPADDDEDILGFVFGGPAEQSRPVEPDGGRGGPTLDGLPRRSRLERAIIDHLRAGRHWSGGVGWLEL